MNAWSEAAMIETDGSQGKTQEGVGSIFIAQSCYGCLSSAKQRHVWSISLSYLCKHTSSGNNPQQTTVAA